MKARKIKWLIVAVFALALVGGGAAGMLAARYALRRNAQAATDDGSLSRQLQLSSNQRTQIRQVWEQMRDLSDDCYRHAQSLDQQRQDAIFKLLTDQQKKKYEKIQQDYQDQYTRNTAKREAAFDDAVAKTKQFLNDWQRHRYDQILAQRMGSGPASQDARPSDSRAAGAAANSSSISAGLPSSD